MKNSFCIECGKPKPKRNKYYCGHSCQMTAKNRESNPAKTKEAREKISAAAKKRGNEHMMTPEAREKAAIGISKSWRWRKHSEETKKKISEGVKRAGCIPPRNTHLVGKKHPNWKGGYSKLRPREYEKQEYKDFRNGVLQRDDYSCQDCNKRGGKLEVHHIKEWGPYPKLRYEITNGVTLCRECHLNRHRGKPRPVTIGPRVVSDLPSNRGES